MGKMVWLRNVRNEAEAGMAAGILENEGIPVRVFSRGAGQVYSMDTLFGAEIQVPEEAHERAQELLDAYFQENEAFMQGGFSEETAE